MGSETSDAGFTSDYIDGWAKRREISGVLFKMLDGRGYADLIWKQVRPHGAAVAPALPPHGEADGAAHRDEASEREGQEVISGTHPIPTR